MRSWESRSVDHPAAPNGLCILSANADGDGGRLSDDGKRIEGQWESSQDGQNWELDFQLNYLKLA